MSVLEDAYDYFVFFLASVFGGTGGGGGGAFYVQIFSSFFDGEHTAFAAALSCAPMLATAAAILFANQFFRATAPAVAKDVFCITEPLTLLGTVIGTRLQKIAPFWLTLIVTVVALLPPTISVFRAAYRWAHAERAAADADAIARDVASRLQNAKTQSSAVLLAARDKLDSTSVASVLPNGAMHLKSIRSNQFDEDMDDLEADVVDAAHKAVAVLSPSSLLQATKVQHVLLNRVSAWRCYGSVALSFAVVLLVNLMVSGTIPTVQKSHSQGVYIPGEEPVYAAASLHHHPALHPNALGVMCGTVVYYFLLALSAPILIAIVISNMHHVRQLYHVDRTRSTDSLAAYKAVEGDENGSGTSEELDESEWVMWPSLLQLGGGAFVAGVVSGHIGFGGPIIKAPFLLALHISPQDASQTMQAMLAVATSASLLQYAFLHMLPPLESLALFATHAFIGSFIGKRILDYVVDSQNRPSLILHALVLYALATWIFATGAGTRNLIDILGKKFDRGVSNPWHFHALCGAIRGK